MKEGVLAKPTMEFKLRLHPCLIFIFLLAGFSVPKQKGSLKIDWVYDTRSPTTWPLLRLTRTIPQVVPSPVGAFS